MEAVGGGRRLLAVFNDCRAEHPQLPLPPYLASKAMVLNADPIVGPRAAELSCSHVATTAAGASAHRTRAVFAYPAGSHSDCRYIVTRPT